MEYSIDTTGNNNFIKNYKKTDDYIADIICIIESAQNVAYHAVNYVMVQRNWYICQRIAEEELQGQDESDF